MYTQIFKLHAKLLKALSHPKRLEVIHLLRDQKLSVTDIHTMLDLPQANLSQHLMVLRQAGVVRSTREGKQIFYQIAHPNFTKTSDLMRQVLIEQNQDDALSQSLTLKMSDLLPIVHDPVCQMRISPKTAGFSIQHNHQTYYFCASGCKKQFQQNPAKFI